SPIPAASRASIDHATDDQNKVHWHPSTTCVPIPGARTYSSPTDNHYNSVANGRRSRSYHLLRCTCIRKSPQCSEEWTQHRSLEKVCFETAGSQEVDHLLSVL